MDIEDIERLTVKQLRKLVDEVVGLKLMGDNPQKGWEEREEKRSNEIKVEVMRNIASHIPELQGRLDDGATTQITLPGEEDDWDGMTEEERDTYFSGLEGMIDGNLQVFDEWERDTGDNPIKRNPFINIIIENLEWKSRDHPSVSKLRRKLDKLSAYELEKWAIEKGGLTEEQINSKRSSFDACKIDQKKIIDIFIAEHFGDEDHIDELMIESMIETIPDPISPLPTSDPDMRLKSFEEVVVYTGDEDEGKVISYRDLAEDLIAGKIVARSAKVSGFREKGDQQSASARDLLSLIDIDELEGMEKDDSADLEETLRKQVMEFASTGAAAEVAAPVVQSSTHGELRIKKMRDLQKKYAPGDEAPSPLTRGELEGMKLSALRKRAMEAGVDEEKLDEADDEDDIKAAVIALIVARESGGQLRAELEAPNEEEQALRAELEGMKLSEVKKRAREVGVEEEKLEEADDEDDIKAAVIELIIEYGKSLVFGGSARRSHRRRGRSRKSNRKRRKRRSKKNTRRKKTRRR